jgi:hypothetical protein
VPYDEAMKTAAMGLAKSVIRPAIKSPVTGATPNLIPESPPIQGDNVMVGAGPLTFRVATKYVEPAVEGISEGFGVTAGTLAGAATTALGVACYPASATAVGIATAAACLTADVEGETALGRGAKKVALAATLAPTAALFAPAVMGAAVAVATEEVVTEGTQWGINRFLIHPDKSSTAA